MINKKEKEKKHQKSCMDKRAKLTIENMLSDYKKIMRKRKRWDK